MSTAVRHEVLKAMSGKSSVLWYVTTCNLVERGKSFETILHIQLQDKREVEAAWYTDILVYLPTYQTTRRRIQKDKYSYG
jgi:hypothetical protein